jgi:hypothetical protein
MNAVEPEAKFYNPEKFLLCRPQGGLNDTLCQIENCWRYAERYGRTLIVDTKRSGGVQGVFSEFFQPKTKSTTLFFELSEDRLANLNGATCFPAEIRGRLNTYIAEYDYSKFGNFFLDRETSVEITFDFTKDYDETLLVHEQCGGGTLSFDLLPKLIISDNLRPTILDRISHLNGEYYAVHVRNTDLRTSFKAFFSKILPEVENKSLLVCSDDAAVIAYAQRFFISSKILFSSEVPNTQGKSLHFDIYSDDRQRKKMAVDAIVDLIAMGRSTKLFFSDATLEAGRTSGFSLLAEHLWNNKNLIESLLGISLAKSGCSPE